VKHDYQSCSRVFISRLAFKTEIQQVPTGCYIIGTLRIKRSRLAIGNVGKDSARTKTGCREISAPTQAAGDAVTPEFDLRYSTVDGAENFPTQVIEKEQMRRKLLYLTFLLIETLCLGFGAALAQNRGREIAITIDDLPLNGPSFEVKRLDDMTRKLLHAIKKHKAPTVGFVNETQLYVAGETDARIGILKTWVDAGVELGNHTFSHMGFENASLSAYEDDFIRGETICRMLMKQKGQSLRYFRHPFLQMGKTFEIEQAFEKFIAERGYQIAPVTIDSKDWMFLAAYASAKKQGDAQMVEKVSDEYLKFVGLACEFAEKTAAELFGHDIKHILLLHSNELNADNLDALLGLLKNRGYQFITLEQALTDPVYKYPEKYRSTSDWLSLWAFNKGLRLAPPAPPEFIQKRFVESQKR
jgi:peptidoglycan-N-acetylglucosamine deacetylase